MDWATFLQDNSQSLFTLLGVFLGSGITLLMGAINNRFQTREREKDREEHRREALIHSKEKWIERDILQIMDSIQKSINLFSEYFSLKRKIKMFDRVRKSPVFSKDELQSRLKSYYLEAENIQNEISKTHESSNVVVYSFGEEVKSTYTEYLAAEILLYSGLFLPKSHSSDEKISDEELVPRWIDLKRKSGECHKALRNILISLRDT